MGWWSNEAFVTTFFTSDGCSVVHDLDQTWICIRHDYRCFCGGSWREFWDTNREYFRLIRKYSNYRWTGYHRWLGVTIGALPFFPTPFRWGFGNDWPHKEAQPGDYYTVENTRPTAIRLMWAHGAPHDAMVELWGEAALVRNA